MAGAIGYGVADGLRRAQRRGSRKARPPSPGRAWLYFVVGTWSLSILTAGWLGPPRLGDGPLVERLLWASVYYAAVMGWPPLVGAWLARWSRDEQRPAGVRGARVRHVALALVIALGLAVGAAVLALVAGGGGGGDREMIGHGPAAAALGVFVVLWTQAMTEEYGWRGSPLVWAVEHWGERLGLIVHGVVWGVWYAPLILMSGPTPSATMAAAGGFVITCLLLGIVFGWLRLRSGSILPSALANAVLTTVAGLPLVFHGEAAGARDAVYRWPGWPVIGVVAIVVLVRRPHAPRRAAGEGGVGGGTPRAVRRRPDPLPRSRGRAA